MAALPPGTLLGRSIRRWSVGDLTLTESGYGCKSRLRRHAHARPHFCVVLEGQYDETLPHGTERRGPGAVIFLPADCPHAERHYTEGRHLIVELDEALIDQAVEEFGLPSDPQPIDRSATVAIVWRIQEELRHDRASAIMLEGLALELVAAGARSARLTMGGSSPQWLQGVEHILESRFAEPLTIQLIAKSVGLHPTHLARAFRTRTGETPGAALRRIRLRAAAAALSDTDLPIAAIAANAGFSDHSHLTRLFRRYMGISPSCFRRREQAKPR